MANSNSQSANSDSLKRKKPYINNACMHHTMCRAVIVDYYLNRNDVVMVTISSLMPDTLNEKKEVPYDDVNLIDFQHGQRTISQEQFKREIFEYCLFNNPLRYDQLDINEMGKFHLAQIKPNNHESLSDLPLGSILNLPNPFFTLNNSRKARLCWTGTYTMNENEPPIWFIGIEIHVHNQTCFPATFGNHTLWKRYGHTTSCHLFPVLHIGNLNGLFSKLRRRRRSKNSKEDKFELKENNLWTLGSHVWVTHPFSELKTLAIVVWLGELDTNSGEPLEGAVVKLTLNRGWEDDVSEVDLPFMVSLDWPIPGFYGKFVFVTINRLLSLPDELKDLTVPELTWKPTKTESSLRKMRITMKDGDMDKFVSGELLGELFVNDNEQPLCVCFAEEPVDEPPKNMVFLLSYLVHFIELNQERRLVIVEKAAISPITPLKVATMSLPDEIKPLGYRNKQETLFKVFDPVNPNSRLGSGIIRWTGKINDSWCVGLEMEEIIQCPKVKANPRLKNLFPLRRNGSYFFVHPDCVSMFEKSDTVKPRDSINSTKHVFNDEIATKTSLGVTHDRQFFRSLQSCSADKVKPSIDFDLNYLVIVTMDSSRGKRQGACRFIGQHQTTTTTTTTAGDERKEEKVEMQFYIGIELDCKTYVDGSTNGTFPAGDLNGIKLFECRDKYGILVSSDRVTGYRIGLQNRDGTKPQYTNPVTRVIWDVPHHIDFFRHLTILHEEKIENLPDLNLPIMTNLAESSLSKDEIKLSGICRWRGIHDENKTYFIGVQLFTPQTVYGTTSGYFPYGQESENNLMNKILLFECDADCGIVVPISRVSIEMENTFSRRINDRGIKRQLSHDVKKLEFKSVQYFNQDGDHLDDDQLSLSLVKTNEDCCLAPCFYWKEEYCHGFTEVQDNGIQGKNNSCYLDTTLFAMFAMNDTFDTFLIQRENVINDWNFESATKSRTPESVRRSLRILIFAIINPLRKQYFVPQVNVGKFRKLFEENKYISELTGLAKDPEEFLNVFFEKLLKAPCFLKYRDGDEAHMLQLFFQLPKSQFVLSVDKMISLTFDNLNCKLDKMPDNLIMQVPREKGAYINFQMVDLTRELDMSGHVVPDSVMLCMNCNENRREIICIKCQRKTCRQCVDNSSPCLKDMTSCEYQWEFVLELYAVLCINVSHYVAFIRVPHVNEANPASPAKIAWYFFDSMSSRNNSEQNVPAVKLLPNLEEWLISFHEKLHENKVVGDLQLMKHPFGKRLVTTAYTLFYRRKKLFI